MWKVSVIKCIFLIFFVVNGLSDNCEIPWIKSGHEVVESQYVLQLSIFNTTGDLHTYFPNTNYDVTIKSKLRNHTFTQFYFTIWNINKTLSYGSLELREKDLSMFHNGPYCINRIIDGPVSLAKLKLTIGWQSPSVNSGCIEFRAAIKETELRYHTTNITVCQDPRVDLDNQGEILKNCCACDEGKYELTFEGLWSRYTHPKNFPRREWLAVFPTIIGASHIRDYEFWRVYTKASSGLKKFAESGYTVDLELELKANKNSIGTLVKFRGANFQNKTRKSFAEVRVDKNKHLVSLIGRIEPSPDWFIGISSLELCQFDCTWIEQKTINLYAYDAGVRNGILYEDLDELTEPPDVIQHLNMTWPLPQNNIESPFYDITNNTHDVRPLARIHFTRLRGSEKICHVYETEECVTHWSSWSNCSVQCGTGIKQRTRSFITPYNEENCTESLIESTTCQMNFNCPREITKEDCALTEWSEWEKCDRICGKEVKKRTRSFKRSSNGDECKQKYGEIVLQEKMDCGNPPCPHSEWGCNDALYNPWSDWTPCSLTEGIGHKVRYRTIKETVINTDQGNHSDYGNSMCFYDSFVCNSPDVTGSEHTVVVTNEKENLNRNKEIISDTYSKSEKPGICFENVDRAECQDGSEDSLRYYYDQDQDKCKVFRYYGCGGNNNNFKDEKKCNETCVTYGKKIDCLVSSWTDWTPCRSCNDIRMREKNYFDRAKKWGKSLPLIFK